MGEKKKKQKKADTLTARVLEIRFTQYFTLVGSLKTVAIISTKKLVLHTPAFVFVCLISSRIARQNRWGSLRINSAARYSRESFAFLHSWITVYSALCWFFGYLLYPLAHEKKGSICLFGFFLFLCCGRFCLLWQELQKKKNNSLNVLFLVHAARLTTLNGRTKPGLHPRHHDK